eukprot:c15086_g1_i1 orf=30-977(+)
MAFLCSNSYHLLSSSTSIVNTASLTATSRGAHLYVRRAPAIPSQQRRKRWKACCPSMSSPLNNPVLDEPAIMELPCLPFNPAEVFIPTATKTLHLYEARFLALLEEAISKYHNMFAHIVIEPVSDGVEEGVLSFATKYGCLAQIESVRRMDVGALVTIRGVGRLNLAKLTQLEPFLKGSLVPVHDAASTETKDIDAAVEGLKLVLADVQRLQIKLRTSKDELLQTPLENALQWVEKGVVQDPAKSFVPSKAESLSFASLQPVTSASATELHALLQERMGAMEATSTLQRLQKVTKHAEQNRSSLAAKVALQSLQF